MTFCAVIPTNNRRTLIAPAVESELEQTRPPEKIVVVDDGSADGTADALFGRECRRPAKPTQHPVSYLTLLLTTTPSATEYP